MSVFGIKYLGEEILKDQTHSIYFEGYNEEKALGLLELPKKKDLSP